MNLNKIFQYSSNLVNLIFCSKNKFTVFSNILFAKISFPKKISFFKNNKIYGKVDFGEEVSIFNISISGDVKIGKFTSINGPNTSIVCHGNKVSIGSFCSIARNVQIQGHNHNYKRATSSSIFKSIFKTHDVSDYEVKGDIIIEDDVWIGTNSVILSGVKIGRGAIVAAGSIVSKDVESYSIVGGIPAKLIKKRFTDKTILELENSKWWEWETSKILENKEFFSKERS